MISNHHFQGGRITRESQFGAEITLSKGVILKQKAPINGRTIPFNFGEEVIVSWVSSSPYPRTRRDHRWVDHEAVERCQEWNRNSKYLHLFTKHPNRDGFKLEEAVRKRLHMSGIRSVTSTPFEDEQLGLDLWIFLKKDEESLWQWYPIDLTLKTLHHNRLESKYLQHLRKGVITLQFDLVDTDSPKFLQNFSASLKLALIDFSRHNQELLSRQEAKHLEEMYEPQ